MRKLIVEEWITLDGYATDAKGATNFFPTTAQNRQSDEDQLKFLDTIDTILLGRKTYEIFADYWPKATHDEEIVADKINEIPKVVISNKIKEAPWGRWPAAEVKSGPGVDTVQQLKQGQGKDIIVWGSISLVQALMNADLVDEYHIQVCPVRLGDGRLLFPQNDSDFALELMGTKMYDESGVVFSKYSRKRWP